MLGPSDSICEKSEFDRPVDVEVLDELAVEGFVKSLVPCESAVDVLN